VKKSANLTWESDGGALPTIKRDCQQWYALQTRHKYEKKVSASLASLGWDIFLPMLRSTRQWSDRRKKITTPLFPGYTFVQLDEQSLVQKKFLQTDGVLGLISFGGNAVPVAREQIETLRRIGSMDVPFSLHPFLKAGQRVRICGGCLDRLEGVLLQAEGKKLVISIDCIQRAVAISIEGYELQLL